VRIPESEARLFYELHVGLQLIANRRHGIIRPVNSFDDFMALPPDDRLKIRDALCEHPECFDEFLREGDLSASLDAAEIVARWRDHRVAGTFYILLSWLQTSSAAGSFNFSNRARLDRLTDIEHNTHACSRSSASVSALRSPAW